MSPHRYILCCNVMAWRCALCRPGWRHGTIEQRPNEHFNRGTQGTGGRRFSQTLIFLRSDLSNNNTSIHQVAHSLCTRQRVHISHVNILCVREAEHEGSGAHQSIENPENSLYRVFLSTVTNKFGLRAIKMFQIKF